MCVCARVYKFLARFIALFYSPLFIELIRYDTVYLQQTLSHARTHAHTARTVNLLPVTRLPAICRTLNVSGKEILMVQELVIHTTLYLPSPSIPLSLNAAFFNAISLIFESARACVYTSPAFGPHANPLISCMTNSPTSGGINQTQTHMHMWTDINTQRDEK